MATFKLRVLSRKGAIEKVVEAKTQAEALKVGSHDGRVLSIKKQVSLLPSRGMSPAERQTFLQRMSAMLASRVGSGDALRLMRDNFKGRISAVSGRLLRYIESGADLAGAIENVGAPDFPKPTIALIKAGASGGESYQSLQDAANFEIEMRRIKESSGKGLWGALAAILMAMAVTIGSTQYLGPKVLESPMIGKQEGVNIDWLFPVGDAVTYVMIFILVILGVLGWLGTVGRMIIPEFADKVILSIPFYRDLVLARNNYTALYGLSLMIRAGVRLEEALKLSHDSTPRGALRSDFAAAVHAVQTGTPWAKAMKTLHPTDKAALAISEDRKQIAGTLRALADQYREIYGQRLASLTPILQLLAAVFLSIGGGLVFGMTILPMLQAMKGML